MPKNPENNPTTTPTPTSNKSITTPSYTKLDGIIPQKLFGSLHHSYNAMRARSPAVIRNSFFIGCLPYALYPKSFLKYVLAKKQILYLCNIQK
jgi:hypothetical protein